MRSLTHSSADTHTHNVATIPLPVTPLRPHPSLPTSHGHSSLVTTPGQALRPLPHPFSTPTANRRAFFDVSNDTPLLSLRSRDYVTRAIQNGWATTTIKRYSASVEQFIRFCDIEGVSDHLRFPADEFILCAFAASSLGRHSRSTVRNRLSALKAWHIAHNMEWKGSARLRYVLNGIHHLAPGTSKHPPRPPINAKMIAQLIESLDPNSGFDAAVAACAATAFWGQCRLGELLPSTPAALLSTPFPTRAGFKRSVRNPQSCILHLPRTKTHHHGQDIVLVDQCAAVNPILLLKRHLRMSAIPDDAHIFSYSSPEGLKSLTKSLFLQRCNTIWQHLGYPRTTGHCFRIGGTTELLLAGTPPDVVKATGRWSSDSFLRYWRSLDDIAPQYIRHLHTLRRRRRHT
jgi:hypothetical protein